MLLKRIEHPNGPIFYLAPLLWDAGIPHAFSTRLGGLSAAPFDSLNLGNPSGEIQDTRARILENYRLLETAAGTHGRERCWLHQVHGSAVANVIRNTAHDSDSKGDALTNARAACRTQRPRRRLLPCAARVRRWQTRCGDSFRLAWHSWKRHRRRVGRITEAGECRRITDRTQKYSGRDRTVHWHRCVRSRPRSVG